MRIKSWTYHYRQTSLKLKLENLKNFTKPVRKHFDLSICCRWSQAEFRTHKSYWESKPEQRKCSRISLVTTINVIYCNIWTYKSFRYLGPKILGLLPNEWKNINSITAFKNILKQYEFTNCPYILCMEYVQGVGYSS